MNHSSQASLILAIAMFAVGCSQSAAQSPADDSCTVDIAEKMKVSECPSGKITFHYELSNCKGSAGEFNYTYTTLNAKGQESKPLHKGAAWTRPGQVSWDQVEFPSLACDETFGKVEVLQNTKQCRCTQK